MLPGLNAAVLAPVTGSFLRDYTYTTSEGGEVSLDLDTLGLKYSVGDTVVVMFCAEDNADSSWSWLTTGTNIAITDGWDLTGTNDQMSYAGHGVIGSGESTINTEDVGGRLDLQVIFVLIYSGAPTLTYGVTGRASGEADPPTAGACNADDHVVVFGHIDDVNGTLTLPSGYSGGNVSITNNSATKDITASWGYKISAGATENPGTFTSSTTGAGSAGTIRIQPA